MSFLEFKNKFINNVINQNSNINIQNLKNSLNKIPLILKNMEGNRLIMIRDLICDETIGFNYISEDVSCKYDFFENELIVGIISPDWSKGWRNISSNKYISEIISDYMYFLNQYVYRSYFINIIGALALVYGKSSSFFGQSMFRYGHYNIGKDYKKFTDTINRKYNNLNTNYRMFVYIMSKINALDPYVNRAIFYYSKSLGLITNLFEEEAIISLDNCIDIIIQFIKIKEKLPTKKRKEMHRFLKEVLYINDLNIKYLDYIYDLRCDFGAHPAKSLWWDFNEIHMNNYEDIIYNVRLILIKFIEYEYSNRIVLKRPISWYEWFMDNCDLIYDFI